MCESEKKYGCANVSGDGIMKGRIHGGMRGGTCLGFTDVSFLLTPSSERE